MAFSPTLGRKQVDAIYSLGDLDPNDFGISDFYSHYYKLSIKLSFQSVLRGQLLLLGSNKFHAPTSNRNFQNKCMEEVIIKFMYWNVHLGDYLLFVHKGVNRNTTKFL